jgi:hypothetical protein
MSDSEQIILPQPVPEKTQADNPAGNSLASDSSAANWLLIPVLLVAGFFTSLSFNIYLIRQNDSLSQQRKLQLETSRQADRLEAELKNLVNELGIFSTQHPSVLQVIKKYPNIVIVPPDQIGQQPQTPPIPLPPQEAK